jgi:hypothetical protein
MPKSLGWTALLVPAIAVGGPRVNQDDRHSSAVGA